ncbi:hypothetical protein [Delftia sp.]|uniref:hypothetical protein n=1 Tax=Delftia sp. TaxID=1886637 RepID=UPI00259C9E9C|nr:hypothetical protein [Delftia sp.]
MMETIGIAQLEDGGQRRLVARVHVHDEGIALHQRARAVQIDGGAAIDLDGVVAHHVVGARHDDGAAAGFDLEVFCCVEGGWGVVPGDFVEPLDFDIPVGCLRDSLEKSSVNSFLFFSTQKYWVPYPHPNPLVQGFLFFHDAHVGMLDFSQGRPTPRVFSKGAPEISWPCKSKSAFVFL